MKHQIFTPEPLVEEMLDSIKYKYNILDKKVIDSACGNGEILSKILERYIEDARLKGLKTEEIIEGIETNIYGYEVDEFYFNECINRLNLIAQNNNLFHINWSIYNRDYLHDTSLIKYDFIIGNPPYIKYHDIKREERNFLRSNYTTCQKGNFDYYYAFLEKDFLSLNDNGQLIYLIPINTFKNVFAKELRNLIKDDVVKIVDFGENKIFKNILTTSAVLQLKKNSNSSTLNYISKKQNESKIISKHLLKDIWYFNDEFNNLRPIHKFGDYFKASMSVATLKNDIFILKNFTEFDEYLVSKDLKFEKGIFREAVSPRSMQNKQKHFIIFPYSFKEEKVETLSERYIKNKYPNVFQHLLNNKRLLSNRKINNATQWYEYGRKQAISNMNKRKLMMSTIITNNVNVYNVKEEIVVYSGIYIYSISEVDINIAKNILESKEFLEYIILIGVNTSGNSYRISAKDINNFPLNKRLERYYDGNIG